MALPDSCPAKAKQRRNHKKLFRSTLPRESEQISRSTSPPRTTVSHIDCQTAFSRIRCRRHNPRQPLIIWLRTPHVNPNARTISHRIAEGRATYWRFLESSRVFALRANEITLTLAQTPHRDTSPSQTARPIAGSRRISRIHRRGIACRSCRPITCLTLDRPGRQPPPKANGSDTPSPEP